MLIDRLDSRTHSMVVLFVLWVVVVTWISFRSLASIDLPSHPSLHILEPSSYLSLFDTYNIPLLVSFYGMEILKYQLLIQSK